MFEILIVLTVIGVLYVEIIEILEKCEHLQRDAAQGGRQDHQVAF